VFVVHDHIDTTIQYQCQGQRKEEK